VHSMDKVYLKSTLDVTSYFLSIERTRVFSKKKKKENRTKNY